MAEEPGLTLGSWTQFFGGLIHPIIEGNRVVAIPELLERFAGCVRDRTNPHPKGTPLFRARHATPREDTNSYPLRVSDIGPPPPHLAAGNRMNPPGIPYLYLAEDAETAAAELKPSKGDILCIGEFWPRRDLILFDFVAKRPESDELEGLAERIGGVFSEPEPLKDARSYAASQYLSEFLKSVRNLEVDGIRYPSAMREEGVNVALFGGRTRYPGELGTWPKEAAMVLVRDVDVKTKPWESPRSDDK